MATGKIASRQQQHASFLHTLGALEEQLTPPIQAARNEFYKKCAKRYLEHRTINHADLMHKHQEQILLILNKYYKKCIIAMGTLAFGHVRHAAKEDEDSLFLDLADDWIQTQGLQRSTLIADTAENDVMQAIQDGMDAGLSVEAVSSTIESLTELSNWQANRVARTEMHAAANYAQIESVRTAEQRLGLTMLKAWQPTIDSRTRDAHAEMDGTDAIAMDALFIVDGEEMDSPGDPNGSPENIINCRCCLVFEEGKDE